MVHGKRKELVNDDEVKQRGQRRAIQGHSCCSLGKVVYKITTFSPQVRLSHTPLCELSTRLFGSVNGQNEGKIGSEKLKMEFFQQDIDEDKMSHGLLEATRVIRGVASYSLGYSCS